MVRRLAWVLAVLQALAWNAARSEESAKLGPARLGARFEYMLTFDDQATPYPWNVTTHSASDRSRLMLDLAALETRYGSFYVKGAAMWAMVGAEDVKKEFVFEQGDYLWLQNLETWWYSIRLFANERRFFAYDWTAPLVDDDRAGTTRDNRGVRVDAAVRERLRVTGLYSLLGDDVHDSRSISYVKSAFSHRAATFSASYVTEDPGANGLRNHAVVKAELASAYKKVFAAVSYEQSGFEESRWFFPGGSWDWSAYDGTNFSAVLPWGAAALAEVRLSSLPLRDQGDIDIVWRYQAVGEDFVNDLGPVGPSCVGQTLGAYFVAKDVSVNAKALYHKSTRSVLEDEKREGFDAGVWAALKNGMDCYVRGGAGTIDDEMAFDTEKSFVHGGLGYRTNRVRTGVHAMWNDFGTPFSGERFAWDGKLVISSDWGFHWRFLVAQDYALGESAFFRLEYRPSRHVWVYAGYGRPYLGDDPFVLEDGEIGLLREDVSQYTISVRGDF